MNLLTFGFFTFASCALLVGCGGVETSSADAAVQDAAVQDAAVQDATSMDASPVTLDCTTYCDEIQENCTGPNAQFDDKPSCMATCASFEVGTSKVTDTIGNTLGCRIYHAGAPAIANPGTHCAQAGPTGDVLRAEDAGTTMGCSGGDVCQNFCTLEIKACGSQDFPLDGDPKDATNNSLYQYQNTANCMQACGGFDKTHPYSTSSMGDSFACRLGQATRAVVSVNAGSMFCRDTANNPIGRCTGTATP